MATLTSQRPAIPATRSTSSEPERPHEQWQIRGGQADCPVNSANGRDTCDGGKPPHVDRQNKNGDDRMRPPGSRQVLIGMSTVRSEDAVPAYQATKQSYCGVHDKYARQNQPAPAQFGNRTRGTDRKCRDHEPQVPATDVAHEESSRGPIPYEEPCRSRGKHGAR